MSILIAILLGIVQGLTEFLPVSSSGHLVLLQQIFKIENNIILFDVILHLGTLIAVFFVFKKSILNLIKHPFSKTAKRLYLATIITLILAFLFKDFFEESFSGSLLALSFLVTAIFLLIAQFVSNKNYNVKEINYKKSAIIGLFQGAAILPGISRSGATITSAIVQGVKKEEAAEFSFLLSIPIILASLVWELLKTNTLATSLEVVPILLGFVFATIFGIFAIKIMLKVIAKAKYYYFSIYLIFLSAFLILNDTVLLWF